MDVLSTLVVRFHFNGQFVKIGNRLYYFGGLEAMSYIERDKMSARGCWASKRSLHYIRGGFAALVIPW